MTRREHTFAHRRVRRRARRSDGFHSVRRLSARTHSGSFHGKNNSVATLVAFGLPPNRVKLFDIHGRDLHATWHFDPKTFNGTVRAYFEGQLRKALSAFLAGEVPDIAHAEYRYVTDASSLMTLVRSGRYSHVIYYGHADIKLNVLAPVAERKITGAQLKQIFAGSAVKRFDILGCQAGVIAAQLASDVPGLDVGYLRGTRYDEVDVDMRTRELRGFSIVPQKVFHFVRPAGSP